MRALVVGGGLAGAAAALELSARGAEVVLVRVGPGATALTWGTLDVAAASPLRRGGLALREGSGGAPLAPLRRLEAVVLANPAHPYATLWRERSASDEVKEAAAILDGWLAPSGLRVVGELDRTRFLADVHGQLRAADLALSGCGEGALDEAEEIALVDVPGLAGFDARPALRRLAAELSAVGLGPRSLRVVRLVLPAGLAERAASPARLARALEDEAAQAALGPALAAIGAAGRLLLFPPVLGLERPDRVLDWGRAAARAPVAELVGAPGLALAGARLQHGLDAALARAAIEVRSGRVVGVDAERGRARAVWIAAPDAERAAGERRGEPLACDALVLATGRFVGGGLTDRDGRLAEPILDLALRDQGGRRVDGIPPRRLARRDYEGEQPLFGAGVRVDTRLRPLGPAGLALFDNVFAAGELLGSFDPARDRTGLGVALLSGRRAGAEASRC